MVSARRPVSRNAYSLVLLVMRSTTDEQILAVVSIQIPWKLSFFPRQETVKEALTSEPGGGWISMPLPDPKEATW